ncbi:hypothetical protein ACN9MC_04925 [Ensifer adhaerens]|uniref:hypothetical protein n=1 Tax=Ensifer adhaerens TaxID=106592 RepID=UPI003CEE0BA0
MKLIFRSAMLLVAGASATSCASPNQVADPTEITLERAINEVADSLNNLQTRTANRQKIGLIVDQATVTFNVAATATNTASANGSLNALPLGTGGTGTLSVSNSLVNDGTRGNTITVVFKNIATADYSKGGLTMVERCRKNPSLPECKKIMQRGIGG